MVSKLDNISIQQEIIFPDTEPTTDSQFSQPFGFGWGRLLPLRSSKRIIVLTDRHYVFGREPSCDISINDKEIENKIYRVISKFHFRIRREMEEEVEMVYLDDLSSNGTFINGKLIGRNRTMLIKNSDEISVGRVPYTIFEYKSTSIRDSWLGDSLRNKYEVLKHLGAGGYAEVKLVLSLEDSTKLAMKKISKNRTEETKIFNEINILKDLSHENVIQMFDIINVPEAVFLVLEYMPSGDLKDYVEKNRSLKPDETQFIFYQLLKGVEYLHSKGITHRDLKPENVLLRIKEEAMSVKITDFGLSKVIDSCTNLKTACGTLLYAAPEILLQIPYTNKVDVWSLGIILFYCLSGEFPFILDKSRHCLSKQIINGEIHRSEKWKFISKQASKLVDKMLHTDPIKRFNISQIILSNWMKDYILLHKKDKQGPIRINKRQKATKKTLVPQSPNK